MIFLSHISILNIRTIGICVRMLDFHKGKISAAFGIGAKNQKHIWLLFSKIKTETLNRNYEHRSKTTRKKKHTSTSANRAIEGYMNASPIQYVSFSSYLDFTIAI